jgi:hypothetical protein
MIGDGTLLNRETFNWAEWEPRVGHNAEALEMIRTVTAMRRGPGRDFLVYGRMQRPAEVATEIVRWEREGRFYEVPAVAHAAWQSPDGRHGVVLANWTAADQPVVVSDARLGGKVRIHLCGRQVQTVVTAVAPAGIPLNLPPLSSGMIVSFQ